MLICCFRNEWSFSFTTSACQQIKDGFGDLESGLRLDVLVKEREITCSLLSCSYSTNEITMCDHQEGILKIKEKHLIGKGI